MAEDDISGITFGFPVDFTPRAQQVLSLARKESDRFDQSFVGTEHLLLGLIKLGHCTAVSVLKQMGLQLETVRDEIERQIIAGSHTPEDGAVPYRPLVSKVIDLATQEARALNHTFIGSEHILLGLLLEGDGVAARVLNNLDIDIEQTCLAVMKELDPKIAEGGTSAQAMQIDASRRYDVYCDDGGQRLMVYRNTSIKGLRKFQIEDSDDSGIDFIELEQSNGQNVYVSAGTVVKFCEHGTEIDGEMDRSC
jgi:ATP-dependent Clp protease ATP-binding subunit ClpA